MARINLNNKQLRLIQTALDLYSRVGILQLEEILNNPTIDNCLIEQFTDKKTLVVGDETMRGTVVEIGKDYIKTKGTWGNGPEIKTWKDVKKIKKSPDWSKYRAAEEEIKMKISEIKCLISGDKNLSRGSFGIHSPHVDETSREAFDIIQVIRHEFWKNQEDKSHYSVDSSICKISMDDSVEVKLDDIQDTRRKKINKLNK